MSPMRDGKVRYRLEAQLTKSSSQLCEDLAKALAKFVSQMPFGIQASRDVKLSDLARSLTAARASWKVEETFGLVKQSHNLLCEKLLIIS